MFKFSFICLLRSNESISSKDFIILLYFFFSSNCGLLLEGAFILVKNDVFRPEFTLRCVCCGNGVETITDNKLFVLLDDVDVDDTDDIDAMNDDDDESELDVDDEYWFNDKFEFDE